MKRLTSLRKKTAISTLSTVHQLRIYADFRLNSLEINTVLSSMFLIETMFQILSIAMFQRILLLLRNRTWREDSGSCLTVAKSSMSDIQLTIIATLLRLLFVVQWLRAFTRALIYRFHIAMTAVTRSLRWMFVQFAAVRT